MPPLPLTDDPLHPPDPPPIPPEDGMEHPPPPPPPPADVDTTWIRGVNLGGWLVMERYIVPYAFAITDCHVAGDLCWYDGQLSAPPEDSPEYKRCEFGGASKHQHPLGPGDLDTDGLPPPPPDHQHRPPPHEVLTSCQPLLTIPATGGDPDYPLDEYTLAESFLTAAANNDAHAVSYRNAVGLDHATDWFNAHFDNFITQDDIRTLAETGLTHVRIPLPHWILGDVRPDEPYVVGRRWEAFVRLLTWARQYKLQVWPDIHTAPGSQNGFDNSGHALAGVTCQGWSSDPDHVERSLAVVRDVTRKIYEAGFADVVTGFGVLNEPFKDCNRHVYEKFMLDAKAVVRETLGEATSVYVSDMFLAKTFDNGHWWMQPPEDYTHTYLDSHYYHVFADKPRDLSPRQHIAYTCQKQWRDATSCCYEDAARPWYAPWRTKNTIPSSGVQRIVGEWSAAYDTLPCVKLAQLMQGIAETGVAPEMDKEYSPEKIDFLKHFVEAQMVAYESIETGTSSGWFYWTSKMEGGAFGEWDYLRGIREGWIPKLAKPTQPSQDVYGTCYDVMFETKDDPATINDIIHTFPDPSTLPAKNWQGVAIDDDIVVSHGESILKADGIHHYQRYEHHTTSHHSIVARSLGVAVVAGVMIVLSRTNFGRRFRKSGYTEIGTDLDMVETF